MKEENKFYNYISDKNNAKIAFYTSQSSICYCSNILTDNIKVSKIKSFIKLKK
jgi:hypothetical protein